MKKLLICTLTLVLLFAACSGNPEPAQGTPTTAGVTYETTSVEAALETNLPGDIDKTETAAEDESASDLLAQGETEVGAGNVPTDTAGVVAYYNTALGKTNMRRASFKRVMTKVKSWAVMGLVDEQNMQDWPSVKAMANVDESISASSDLVALRPEWVQGASGSENGGTATLTIRLKDNDFAEIDPKPGTYGYVGTMDKATAEKMVFDASVILTNGILTSADVTKALYALTKGVYTVTIDTQTGKLKSVRFSGTQTGDGEAKCRAVSIAPIPGKATVFLQGDMTSTYLPA